MPSLVPGIHVLDTNSWMAETSPAMTPEEEGYFPLRTFIASLR